MGSVGMTQEWVLNENISSAETIVQMMFQSIPTFHCHPYFDLYYVETGPAIPEGVAGVHKRAEGLALRML